MPYMLSICDFMFRKSVSQQFCFQFLTSYSSWYPYVKKLHKVPYLAFGTNFFPKITTAKTPTTQIVDYAMRIQNFISCNIIVDFWYCVALCILYSTKSKETSMKRSASAQVKLKYRQRTFYSLLRAYCFLNNSNLNLVEQKFPIKGIRSEFTIKCLKCFRF